MELRTIKNCYIILLNKSETLKLKLLGFSNPKLKIVTILNFAVKVIKKSGIKHLGAKPKIIIAKKSDYLSILIMPDKQQYTSFAVKLQTEKELLTLTEQLYKNKCSKLCVSSVYIFRENYYLLITPIAKSNKPQIIATEFSLNIVKDINKLINIQRFGFEICSIDAIEKLGEAISK